MFDLIFKVLGGVVWFITRVMFQFLIEVIVEFFFQYLPEKFFGYPFRDKDEELVLRRISALKKEMWFKPYDIYETELAQRKSIRKLILRINMDEILLDEEKRNKFLYKLNQCIFDLNGVKNKKTSHI